LAKKGANIIIIGRDSEKAKKIYKIIDSSYPTNKGKFFYADLSLQRDIFKVYKKIEANYKKIDILINNAGAIFSKRQITNEGIEKTFALNHMSYFSLSNLFLRIMESESRIINVASGAHLNATINFDDLYRSKNYSFGWGAYAQSKLCNILFSYFLSKKIYSKNISVNCLHPGLVNSNFGDNNSFLFSNVFKLIKNFYGISEQKGSETIIYLASDSKFSNNTGSYYVKKIKSRSSLISFEESYQKKLWSISEKIFQKYCKE